MTASNPSTPPAAGLLRPCARGPWAGLACALVLAAALQPGPAVAQAAPAAQVSVPATPAGRVVVSGTVPDEATRSAILAKAREVYGADRVVDQLGVGNLVAPPNWAQHVARLITPELKRVSQGELRVSGNIVEITGRVDNAAVQQQVTSQMITQLGNATYTVRNGLRVASSGQAELDAALANRTIEFQPGNAQLTPAGQQVLEQLLPVLQQFKGRRFEVIGHTDNDGPRPANVALSRARAEAVRAYLMQRGVPGESIVTQGLGPDRPVAPNATAEGRARNRRIEFRVLA